MVGSGGRLSEYTSLVSVYLAGFAIMAPFASLLTRHIRADRLLPISFGSFLVACALCGAAPSITLLVGYRILQGISGGLSFRLALTEGMSAGPPESRSRRVVLIMGAFALAAIYGSQVAFWLMRHGPYVGSLITGISTWRWILFANIPVGLVILALLLRDFASIVCGFSETALPGCL
jgi:DHA2 family multidrug resistance protein